MKGYNARLIDEEYRRKKMYQKKSRELCIGIDCNKCKYSEICLNNNIKEED